MSKRCDIVNLNVGGRKYTCSSDYTAILQVFYFPQYTFVEQKLIFQHVNYRLL